ncbi:MAG: GTPase ObgE, partial [Methylococcales bacterium]|nr:GTPase ObgE [Methylococcales bacterium]
ADIPGLIEGAAEGAGLGIQFLKHISRTTLLLHMVDLTPYEGEEKIIDDYNKITLELKKFGDSLIKKERWLIFNKSDLCDPETLNETIELLLQELSWKGRYYVISAIQKQGVKQLAYDMMDYIDELKGVEE